MFPTAFHLTWMVRITAIFHRQMLWGLFFLALVLQAKSLVGSWALFLLWGTWYLRYPFHFSTATRRFGASPFCTSTPPTSLDVAFSLHP